MATSMTVQSEPPGVITGTRQFNSLLLLSSDMCTRFLHCLQAVQRVVNIQTVE